jgi:hypothetical protein
VQFSKHVLGYGSLLGFVELFDANGEANVPTWYSSSLLLISAILLGLIGAAKRAGGEKYANYWIGLCAVFFFISMDEAAAFHEKVGVLLQAALDTSGALYYAWVIPYGILVAVLALAYLRFLIALPKETRFRIMLAGALYVGGAIGLEFFQGYQATHFEKESMTMSTLTTIEETLEMWGIVFFIYALMSYIASDAKTMLISFVKPEPEPEA